MFIVKVLFVSHVVKFTGDFYPEITNIDGFILLYFYCQVTVGFLIIREISFLYDTVVVTIVYIIGESWLRIPVR